MAQKPGQKIDERWDTEQQEKLTKYYGCHPKLLEGFEFFQVSE
jgi:hypothetical protein